MSTDKEHINEFAIVPASLIAKLDGPDLKVAAALQTFASKKNGGWVWAYPWTIAEVAGVHRATISRRLNAMWKAGVVERRERKTQRAGRKSYEYRLILRRDDSQAKCAEPHFGTATKRIDAHSNAHERTFKCAEPHFECASGAQIREQIPEQNPSEPTVPRESPRRKRGNPRAYRLSPLAGAIWLAATDAMRKRSSRKLVDDALAKCREPPDRVLSALRAYVANDEDVAAGRAQPGLHRWINDARYQPWLETAPASGERDEAWWRKAMAYFAKHGDWDARWPARDQCPAHITAEFTGAPA